MVASGQSSQLFLPSFEARGSRRIRFLSGSFPKVTTVVQLHSTTLCFQTGDVISSLWP